MFHINYSHVFLISSCRSILNKTVFIFNFETVSHLVFLNFLHEFQYYKHNKLLYSICKSDIEFMMGNPFQTITIYNFIPCQTSDLMKLRDIIY